MQYIINEKNDLIYEKNKTTVLSSILIHILGVIFRSISPIYYHSLALCIWVVVVLILALALILSAFFF